jgi:hypothetical protein
MANNERKRLKALRKTTTYWNTACIKFARDISGKT